MYSEMFDKFLKAVRNNVAGHNYMFVQPMYKQRANAVFMPKRSLVIKNKQRRKRR